jgi:hypothetical protein
MFFIAKGDCNVIVKDKIGDITEEIKHKVLQPGEHFGVSLRLILIFNRKSL